MQPIDVLLFPLRPVPGELEAVNQSKHLVILPITLSVHAIEVVAQLISPTLANVRKDRFSAVHGRATLLGSVSK